MTKKGFTSKKAMQFKLAYIEAFEAMERLIQREQEQMRPLPGKSYLVTFGQNGPVMREVGRILTHGERAELYEIIRHAAHRLAELYEIHEVKEGEK